MPKRRQKYSVRGGMRQTIADGDSQPVWFTKLVNAHPGRRPGMAIKRDGSVTETITGTLNNPLAMGVYREYTGSSLIAEDNVLLVPFAGTNWRKRDGGTWSTVTADSNTSFSASKQYQFAQIGDTMLIAGKRPAIWRGSGSIERCGTPAPSAAITASLSGTGITGDYKYVYTFYNSTTGLESDWSPASGTYSPANNTVDLTVPDTTVASTADQKRVYRTQDGGSTYFLLTTLALATTAYADSTTDANLGAEIASQYRNAIPPDECYITEAYANRFWLVDATDQSKLVWSEAYDGTSVKLEYFDSASSSVYADYPITGLHRTTAGLLIFGSRDVSLLTGTSPANFSIRPLRQHGRGTQFPNSICSNSDVTVFVSEEGISELGAQGVRTISEDIRFDLEDFMSDAYDSLYVSADWNPTLGEFLFAFSAYSESGTPWILSDTGVTEEWKLSATGVTEGWEISGAGATAENSITRVKIFGYNPKRELGTPWTEYQIDQVQDLNTTQGLIHFLKTPPPSSGNLDPQQPITYVGVHADTDDGKVVALFDPDATMDDSTNISAEAITGRCDPQPGIPTKRYDTLEFDSDYSDPTDTGTVEYVMDYEDPHIRTPTWVTMVNSNSTSASDRKRFPTGRGGFFHLRVTDSSSSAGQPLLTNFAVTFRHRPIQDKR